MYRVVVAIVNIFWSCIAYAQLRPLPGPARLLTDEEVAVSKRNFQCLHRDNYTSEERMTFFPFHKAAQIKVVSFKKPPHVVMGGEVPTRKGYVDYAKLEQIVTLSKAQVDSLTDILYNTGYRGVFHLYSEANCYEPGNAIVFEDAKGRGFAFIELCFSCEGYRVSSKSVKAGAFCAEKFALIKAFFAQAGITFDNEPEITETIEEGNEEKE